MNSTTHKTNAGRLTVAPVAPAMAPNSPEWLRMPLPGQIEPFSGLRRSLLYELAREGRVRTVLLRRPGAQRGVRLIEAASLFGFLRKLCDEQNTGGRNCTFGAEEEIGQRTEGAEAAA